MLRNMRVTKVVGKNELWSISYIDEANNICTCFRNSIKDALDVFRALLSEYGAFHKIAIQCDTEHMIVNNEDDAMAAVLKFS